MLILCKALGALLLLMTGALLGYRKGERFMLRATLLEDMTEFLHYLQSNLRYRRDTTANMLREAARNCPCKKLRFSLTETDTAHLPEALQQALAAFWEETRPYLLPQELEIFNRALLNLGEGSADEETQKLGYALATLTQAAEAAREDAQKQQKLYRAVGVSGGAAAALLFL